MNDKLKICVTGQSEGTSGYATHSQNLAKALHKREDTEVSMKSPLQQGWEKRVSGDLFEMLSGEDYQKENNVVIQMPNQWCYTYNMRPKKFAGFGVFEGTEAPRHWAEEVNKKEVDLVFVPSKHTKEAFMKAGAEQQKIRIVPHGVDTKLFKPNAPIPVGFPKNELKGFNFLYVGGWVDGVNDRKGLDILLKAYTDEFKHGEDVYLIAKLNLAYSRPGWNIGQEVAKLGLKKKGERAEFTIMGNKDQNISYTHEEMAGIYALGDVHVCPTKGEAFGMNFLEAMACGVPNIFTKFGGQNDFCNEENGWGLDYELKPATGGYLYEQSLWANVKVDDLRKKMRYCFDHRDEVKKKGLQGVKDAQAFTWDESAKACVEALQG